jgi:predicted ferric reductase
VRVQPERDSTWTIVLAPDGHAGFTFQPGQFAWIGIDRSPFALTTHPFSFSSSAERAPGELFVSIKELGDFTKTIKDFEPGARVYVDGPHGVFTCDRYEGPGFVFIGGGVGVTPLLSMLRSLADRGDRRPCHLFLANSRFGDIAFREEIEELRGALDLTVVHVLRQPDPGWTGESGRLTNETLRRHLPTNYCRYQYFVCGPTRMMNSMENELVGLGVPFARVQTERFEMV